MPILEELQEASFRGAVFFLDRSSISGGRKDTLKEIVNSDGQVIEDLGLRQPTFAMTGTVAARSVIGLTYKQMRDELLDALQSSAGPGVLNHPFYGPIQNVVCRSFTISESIGRVGIATVTMNFAISNVTGVPLVEAAVLGTVATAALETRDNLGGATGEAYNVNEGFAGNFADAVTKLENFVEVVKDGADKVTQLADQVDQFAKVLSDFAADLSFLIAAPTRLAESVTGVFQSLNGLLQTGPVIFDVMVGLFDFGDLDIKITADTAGSRERQENRNLINSQVQGEALSQAYVAAGTLDLPTVEDIDETQSTLEAQFQKIATAADMDRDSFDSLTKTRIALTLFFNAQRATARRRVDVFVNTIPARVLAYTYYGSSEEGFELARLNSIRDAAFVEGDIEILSS